MAARVDKPGSDKEGMAKVGGKDVGGGVKSKGVSGVKFLLCSSSLLLSPPSARLVSKGVGAGPGRCYMEEGYLVHVTCAGRLGAFLTWLQGKTSEKGRGKKVR